MYQSFFGVCPVQFFNSSLHWAEGHVVIDSLAVLRRIYH